MVFAQAEDQTSWASYPYHVLGITGKQKCAVEPPGQGSRDGKFTSGPLQYGWLGKSVSETQEPVVSFP